MTPAEFTRWFANEAGRLAGLEPDRAADEIGDQLARVDEGLGVETADTERGRELMELGIRLLAPREAVDAVRRLGSLIVDTGLGERAAARIRHLEVEAASEGDAERYLKIAELGEFLAWYAKRHPTSCKH